MQDVQDLRDSSLALFCHVRIVDFLFFLSPIAERDFLNMECINPQKRTAALFTAPKYPPLNNLNILKRSWLLALFSR